MKGVQFVVDKMGQKTGVVIDPKEYAALWEDFYDVAVARARRGHRPHTRDPVLSVGVRPL